MRRMTVLVGLPGSGKSSFLKFVDDPEFGGDVFVYSTDALIEQWSNANGWSYNFGFSKYIDQATKRMNELLTMAFEHGIDVYWDQTNMAPKKRASILAKTPKDYIKHCICMVPPRNQSEWDELRRRLANRPGKNIPDNVIESMARSYVEPSVDEGFHTVTLYDIYGQPI